MCMCALIQNISLSHVFVCCTLVKHLSHEKALVESVFLGFKYARTCSTSQAPMHVWVMLYTNRSDRPATNNKTCILVKGLYLTAWFSPHIWYSCRLAHILGTPATWLLTEYNTDACSLTRKLSARMYTYVNCENRWTDKYKYIDCERGVCKL